MRYRHGGRRMTPVDDGDGEVRVWRVEQLRLQPVSVALYDHFLSGDCFVNQAESSRIKQKSS